MGFIAELLDDLAPDSVFASPEERAEQRGIRRAKEESAHRQHLEQADSHVPSDSQAEADPSTTFVSKAGLLIAGLLVAGTIAGITALYISLP